MDKQTVINKIRKCLALASSANEHEAAAALRQAQKLMELHRISEPDMLSAGVTESDARASACRRPANWEAALANMVSRAFGCALHFRQNWPVGQWVFVGVGANADVAKYAFAVLLRQIKKSRAFFIATECKRLIKTSKVRRADLFCQAWVGAASQKVHALIGQKEDAKAIGAYLLQRHPNMTKLKQIDRNAGRNPSEKNWAALSAGANAGHGAQLSHGVGSTPKPISLLE